MDAPCPEPVPILTPREYVTAFADAQARLIAGPAARGRRHARALRFLVGGWLEPAMATLANRIRRDPEDTEAHRLLGLAQQSAGYPEAAARHLERALLLLRRDESDAADLAGTLRARCEGQLIRLVLLRLYVRLGRHVAARRLALQDETLL